MFQHQPVCDFQRVYQFGNVFLGAIPTPNSLDELKRMGVCRVISVQHPDEVPWDHQRLMDQKGLEYFNFPMTSAHDMGGSNMVEIRRILSESEQFPVLFHCSGAVRVSAAWIAYRVLDCGLTWGDALEETLSVCPMETVWHQAAKSYISEQK